MAPPRRGPAIVDKPSMAPNRQRNIGRVRRGIDCTSILRAPASRPAVPTPATTRPTTSMVDETAVAQSTESKTEKPLASKNRRLMEKSLYALPYRDWKAIFFYIVSARIVFFADRSAPGCIVYGGLAFGFAGKTNERCRATTWWAWRGI